MATNTLDNITTQDGVTLALVERWLVKQLLRQREFHTPLANGNWQLNTSIPQRNGDFVRFHRVENIRLPEKALTDAQDPLSGAEIDLTRVEAPMEFIHDFIGLGQQARLMSWMDLLQTSMRLLRIALKRQGNNLIQDAFKVGRHLPFQYDAAGALSVPVRATVEDTVTIRGNSFTFDRAPSYFAQLKGSFGDLTADDRHTMDLYRHVNTRLKNSGAIKINRMFIAVISDAVKNDLMDDDRYFAAAIRNREMQMRLAENSLADYGGFHWVEEDEPYTETLGGTPDVHVIGGSVHTSHVFGADAYGWVRIGGKNSFTPSFKVQDISKTGNEVTIGYQIPFQALIQNVEWCANVVGPVSAAGINDGS